MAEYAVLIPYVKTEYGESLLMEVRSDKVRQPGEICFPGGRAEPGETPVETAVREACEELGIRPETISITSEPEIEVMADGRRVWSVKAELDSAVMQRIQLSADEVSEVFLLPLRWLHDNPPRHFVLADTTDAELPAMLRGYLSHYGDYRWSGETDYWEFEGHGIWGLTARMVKRLRNEMVTDK